MVMTSARWLIPVAYLTVYLVWGSTYLAIRFGVETMSPSLLFGCRFFLAGLINLALYRALCGITGEAPRRPSRRQVANASGIGCVLLVGGTGLVGWAERTVDSHLAALIVSSTPLWVTLFDSALRRTLHASPSQVLGMALGVAGVAILTGAGGGSVLRPGAGVALLLLAPGSLAGASAASWWAMLYLALFGSSVAFTAFAWLLTVEPAHRVASYALVNPLVAVALGVGWGHETIGPRVWIALPVLSLGLALHLVAPARILHAAR